MDPSGSASNARGEQVKESEPRKTYSALYNMSGSLGHIAIRGVRLFTFCWGLFLNQRVKG